MAFVAPCPAADAKGPGLDASGSVLMIQAAPVIVHFEKSPQYAGHAWLVGAEWQHSSRWLGGYSYFNNSFDQRCHYLYAGYSWPLISQDSNWYLKLTGGVIKGYEKPFEDKIAYNNNGFAPAIVPGVGYKMDRFNVQLNLLGKAGFMVTVGYDLIR